MLVKRVGEPLRRNARALSSPNSDHITINRRERYSDGFRWKLGINTSPCIQSRRGKRCVYCGFLNYRYLVSPMEVGQVFSEVFKSSDLGDVHRLELYVSGSFFDDEEVSIDSRLQIVRLVQESSIGEVVLESRPEFITEENLRVLINAIDSSKVTIAIGVETMDDRVRNRLSKGFSTRDFINSVATIARVGMRVQAYLLLNPPVINNDKNAIADIIGSSKQIISLTGEMRCPLTLAIQPFFIAKNSKIAEEWPHRNPIRPPWLYTIALTLKLLDSIRTNVPEQSLHIILGNEIDNVDPVAVPSNYTSDGAVCSCSRRTRGYLREVNVSQKKLSEIIDRILESPCDCRRIWENEIAYKISDSRR